MSLRRILSYLRNASFIAAVASFSGCVEGDVGAPCNHTSIDSPTSLVVTFPAITCNKLLCVYGEIWEPASDACNKDSDCNDSDTGTQRFECVGVGEDEKRKKCKLKLDYVLQRSMCSQQCETDDDCDDAAVGDTTCKDGFRCTIIQSLGQLCCESLCVCSDGLSDATSEEDTCRQNGYMCDNDGMF